MHIPQFTQQVLHTAEEARGPTQTPLGYSSPNDLEIEMVHCDHRCHTHQTPEEVRECCRWQLRELSSLIHPVSITPFGIYQAHFLHLFYWGGPFKVHKLTVPHWMNTSISG